MTVSPFFYKTFSTVLMTLGGMSWLGILVAGSSHNLSDIFAGIGTSLGLLLMGMIVLMIYFHEHPLRSSLDFIELHADSIDVFLYASLWVGPAYFINPWYSTLAISSLYICAASSAYFAAKWAVGQRQLEETLF